MMILKEYEVCSLGTQCIYNSTDSCSGAKSGRDNEFVCDYVKEGKILEGQPMRMPADKTGRMKVIME